MGSWKSSGVLCGCALVALMLGCGVGRADDGKKGNDTPSASAANAKPADASKPEAGLTDRERLLLDRLEQLERRVAELEAKEGKPNAGAVAASGSVSPSAAATAAATPSVAIAPAPVVGKISPSATSPTLTTESSSAVVPPSMTTVSVSAAIGPKQDQNASAGAPGQAPTKIEPFSDADWTWLNGNPRTKEIYWDSKFFTPEIRADIHYVYDFNHPDDHSMGGSSELFRTNEVQLEQLGVGGDFHYDNVRARLMIYRAARGLANSWVYQSCASPGSAKLK